MRFGELLRLLGSGNDARTQTLPIGHKLYHGANATFEPEDDELIAPAWFSSPPSVVQHFARSGRVMGLVAPITLPAGASVETSGKSSVSKVMGRKTLLMTRNGSGCRAG